MYYTIIIIVSNIDFVIEFYISVSFYCCIFNLKVIVDASLNPKLVNDNKQKFSKLKLKESKNGPPTFPVVLCIFSVCNRKKIFRNIIIAT